MIWYVISLSRTPRRSPVDSPPNYQWMEEQRVENLRQNRMKMKIYDLVCNSCYRFRRVFLFCFAGMKFLVNFWMSYTGFTICGD